MLNVNYIDPLAFEWATWYSVDKKTGRKIRVKIASEQDIRHTVLAGNLNSTVGNIILETRYPYDYKIDNHVFFRGKWWLIDKIATNTDDMTPQAVAFAPLNKFAINFLQLISARWDE